LVTSQIDILRLRFSHALTLYALQIFILLPIIVVIIIIIEEV